MAASWQQTASRVQAYRRQSISKIQPAIPDLPLQLPKNVTAVPQQFMTQEELEITQSSVDCLLACLSTGTWTSKTVTLAFLRRAAIAQNLVWEAFSAEPWLINLPRSIVWPNCYPSKPSLAQQSLIFTSPSTKDPSARFMAFLLALKSILAWKGWLAMLAL